MNHESTFLRGILARPDDTANRLSYADWLAKRGDPRGQFVRMDPELECISYVAWLETDGHLDYYLEKFPEVKREAEDRKRTAPPRAQRHALGSHFDPNWVAFLNTMGCRFQPFFFFNNHGSPRECQPDELPFAERIGTRGPVITFESDFRKERAWDEGLMRELGFLMQLKLETCFYGAATCPVHPFLCHFKSDRRPMTGADILASLRARAFHSSYIRDLEATRIPYPGYHPGDGRGLPNDEIHNDFKKQKVFRHEDEESKKDIDELSGTHGVLKRYVAGGQLWYVLLHTTPQRGKTRRGKEYQFSRYAVLLVVGQSPKADRLLGVVTHQVCHNLCD